MRLIAKQAGGGIATYTSMSWPVTANTADARKNDSADASKSGKSLLQEMLSPTGDLAGKILPNEIGIVQAGMSQAAELEASPAAKTMSKAQLYAEMTRRYSQYVTQAVYNYTRLKDAISHFTQNEAAGEVALTPQGYIFVRTNDGEIGLKSVKDFNPQKDLAITNAELADLRANDPNLRFNNNIIDYLMGATSMKEIRDVILQTTQRLDVNIFETERAINPFSEDKPELIAALQGVNITPEDLKTMDLGTLIKVKVKNKSNGAAIKRAINAVKMQLTPQQKSLIALRAKELFGEKADPNALILDFISSMANDEISTTMDITNTFTAGNAELRAQAADKRAEERQIRKEGRDALRKQQEEAAKAAKEEQSPLSKEKLPGPARFVVGMGAKDTIEITDGSKGKFVAYGTRAPITKRGESLGLTSLHHLQNSDYVGSLDLANATIGGKKIEPYKRTHVLAVTDRTINAALPVDIKAARDPKNPVIKPDIDACRRLDEAWAELKDMGITRESLYQISSEEELHKTLQVINQVLQNHQLPVMFRGIDQFGQPMFNITSYKEFAVMDGYVDGDALPEGGKWEEELLRVSGDDQADLIAQFKANAPDKKYSAPDRYTLLESIWHFGNEKDLYEGTIFIPIINDINTVLSTTGSAFQPTTAQATSIYRRQKMEERASNYNPDSKVQQEIQY